MVGLYNIYTDTKPPRARPGPSRPSSASGGPPAAARCGGVTNPTAEHRDAVGRSEAQLGVCIAHPGLSPGPINRRLRRRAQELLLQPVHTFVRYSMPRARRHIAFSQGQCATCGAQRLLKYAQRTICCRYACLKAAAAKRRARHADGSADDAVAMCSASRSWRCLACTSAIPISSSQRSSATSWLLPTRPYARSTSRADRSKRTSIHRLL